MTETRRSRGCAAGALIAGGAILLLLFATASMFSEGGNGTAFLVLGVIAIVAGIAMLLRPSGSS